MENDERMQRVPIRRTRRLRLIYWTDLTAFIGGLLVFATGVVLLLRFHVGPEGATRSAALGMSRLAWVDVHRVAAVLTVAALAAHVYLHWPIISRNMLRILRHAGRVRARDRILYLGFTVVAAAGFVAWLVLPGSPPFLVLGSSSWNVLPPPTERHAVIDVHNLVGMAVLVTVVMHVRPHFGWLLGARRVAQQKRS